MSWEGIVTGAGVVTVVEGDDTTNSRGRYLSLVFPILYTRVGVVFEGLVDATKAVGQSLPLDDIVLPGVAAAVDDMAGLTELTRLPTLFGCMGLQVDTALTRTLVSRELQTFVMVDEVGGLEKLLVGMMGVWS